MGILLQFIDMFEGKSFPAERQPDGRGVPVDEDEVGGLSMSDGEGELRIFRIERGVAGVRPWVMR